MTIHAVPNPAAIQAKAQTDLGEMLDRIKDLTREGQEVHVQISYSPTPNSQVSYGQAFNFPAGADIQPPAAPIASETSASYWQAKDNSFQAGYQQGYQDAETGKPYQPRPD